MKRIFFGKGRVFFVLAATAVFLLFPIPSLALEEGLTDISIIHHHSEACMGDISEYRDADYVGHTGSTYGTCPYCGGTVEYYVFEGRCSCGRTWMETGYACINSSYGDTPSGCPYYEEVHIDTGHLHTYRGYVCGKEGLEMGKITFDISTKDPAAQVVLSATYEGKLETPEMTWEAEQEDEIPDEAEDEKTDAENADDVRDNETDYEMQDGETKEDADESDAPEEEEPQGELPEGVIPRTSSITVKKNGRYNFYASYEEDGETFRVSRSVEIENIDSEPPTFEIIQTPEEWRDGECRIEIVAEDEGFGLAALPYSFDGGETWTDNPVCIITEENSFEIVVRDLAGNRTQITKEISKPIPPKPASNPPVEQAEAAPAFEEIIPVETIAELPPVLPNATGPENGEENPGSDLTEEEEDDKGTDEQIEEEPEEFTGIVLGVSTVAEPDPDSEEKPKGIAGFIKQSYEKAKEAWQQLPEPVQIISVGILSLIGATGVVYGLAFLCGTARISCVTEDGKSRFLARLFIHKEDGCISLHLRKKVMQNAESRKIRIRLPRYYAKAHRYLPLMFSYAGRIYPMHVEQTMELSLDEFS